MRNRSPKPIKRLEDLYEQPRYIFPPEVANGRDQTTRKLYIEVCINFDKWRFPIDEPVVLERRVWHLLNNIGVIQKCKTMQGEHVTNFDPIRNGT